MTPEARKLITRALAALGPAPSDAEMELVTETLHAASDQGVEDAFTAAAAAIWSDGDEQPLEEITKSPARPRPTPSPPPTWSGRWRWGSSGPCGLRRVGARDNQVRAPRTPRPRLALPVCTENVPPCRRLLAVKRAPEPRLVGRPGATTRRRPEMRAETKKKHEMGKRFTLLVGLAAVGVMALGRRRRRRLRGTPSIAPRRTSSSRGRRSRAPRGQKRLATAIIFQRDCPGGCRRRGMHPTRHGEADERQDGQARPERPRRYPEDFSPLEGDLGGARSRWGRSWRRRSSA